MLKTVGNPASRTGDQTIVNGNLVIGTSGKGIDFSADGQASGMTSELLNDYEEGTWTPNQGSGLTVVGAFSSGGFYTKVGRLVTVLGYVAGSTSVNVSAVGQICSNLPFANVPPGATGIAAGAWSTSSATRVIVAQMVSVEAISASGSIAFSATYFV